MPSIRRNALINFVAIAGLAIAAAAPASAQSVISTHAGVIHFFEGAVYLGDQHLESHLGTFPIVPQGAELRTADGKAEVLLTPDVFLRIGDRSSIRMVSNDLADAQVELEAGSVIVDAERADPDTSASILYKNWRIHFLEKGVYRIDSDPPRLLVTTGEAEVFAASDSQPVSVDRGMNLPLAPILVADPASNTERGDALTEWSKGRDLSISSDNAILAELDQDPGSDQGALQAGVDGGGFTYYPMIGLMPPLSPGISASLYNSLYPAQPGFNSIYLPGYTYMPLFVGLIGRNSQLGRLNSPGHPIVIGRPAQSLLPTVQRPLVISVPPRVLTPAPIGGRPAVGVAPRPIVRTPAPAVHVAGHR